MEFPWHVHGTPWTLHGTLWNSMDTPWNSMDTPWGSMELHGTPQTLHGVPWDSIKLHGESIMEFHGILLNFMECPSGVSIEFHGVLEDLKCTTFHGGTMKSTELSYVSNNTHCRNDGKIMKTGQTRPLLVEIGST